MLSIIFHFRYIGISALVFFLSNGLIVYAQITPSENSLSMKVDENKDISFTANGSPATNVKCKWANALFKNFAEFTPIETGNDSKITITAKKATTNTAVILFCGQTEDQITPINIQISPRITAATLTLEGSTIKPTQLKLLKGQTIKINVTANVELEKVDANDSTFSLTGEAGRVYEIKAISKTNSPGKIVAKNGGQIIGINGSQEIAVTIEDITISSIYVIQKNVAQSVVNFPNDLSVKLKLESLSQQIQITSANELLGLSSAPEALVKIKPEFGTGKFEPEFLKIRVDDKAVNLRIIPITGTTVYPDERITLNAVADNDANQPVNLPVRWSFVTASDSQYMTLINGANGSLEVIGLSPPTDGRAIQIQAESADPSVILPPARIAIFVRGKRNVVGFQPIDVRIDMLDERTTKDLFGGRTASEYHVAKIRIVNELSNEQNGGPASSVLFFSDALEVRVSLEKAPKENRNSWLPLNKEDIYFINNWQSCSETQIQERQTRDLKDGSTFCSAEKQKKIARCQTEYQKEYKDYEGKDKNAYNAKMEECKADAAIEELACQRVALSLSENCGCRDTDINCLMRCKFCQRNFNSDNNQNAVTKTFPSGLTDLQNGQWIPFRPFVYQVVANTHDRRADRSWRNRIFLGANMLGGATSFVTSFLIPNPSSDLPLFLDKYQNLLIPTAEKLFPSMREVQRQNIISLILPPIVEVPYGTDVSKYVFFPKKQIGGILPNHWVRITSISSYNIQVKVGIVQKNNAQLIP
jgi:hypothetical protein